MSKVDVKVVLLGKHSVGKTCLVERFLHGKFKENTLTTVGAAFGAKKMIIHGKEITLGIWDTAGQERYESMSRIYYRSARAALVCFGEEFYFASYFSDLSDPKTFEKVRFWVDELLQNEEYCEIYIVGTKLDVLSPTADGGTNCRFTPEEVREYAAKIGAKTFETSAKSGVGIDELFQTIAENYLRKEMPQFGGKTTITPAYSDQSQNANSSKKCCS